MTTRPLAAKSFCLTLLAIAQQYNTTTQALMAANNLSDPNFLRVGQELIIPE